MRFRHKPNISNTGPKDVDRYCNEERPPPKLDPDEVDLDLWLELACPSGDDPDGLGNPLGLETGGRVDVAGESFDEGSSDEGVATLARQLLDALDGDDVSHPPPSANGVTSEQWQNMPRRQRAKYQRLQLKILDPRLLPRSFRWAKGKSLAKDPHRRRC